MIEKISTGIENLDVILNGGIPKYSVNIIGGPPGSGKTILAQQIVFHNTDADSPIPYLVTVSEPTIKIIRYQQQFTFFDPKKITERAVMFLDFSDVADKGGLEAVGEKIIECFEEYHPKIFVIDSFKAIHDLAETDSEIRKFGYKLAVHLSVSECTSFLVGEYSLEDIVNTPIFAIADGIIMLESEQMELQDMRYLNVIKMRGDGYFRGRHPFIITNDGIEVFPRITTPAQPRLKEIAQTRLLTGIAGLDEMFGGGIQEGTISLVAGGAGTGKTLVGLHFITEGAQKGEPGLYVTFQETPVHLRTIAKPFGWDLEALENKGMLKILYTSPVEMSVDQHAMLIKQELKELGAKRVVIDSLMDIEIATFHKVRFKDYVYSLVNYFREEGITAILTNEIPELFGTTQLSLHGISFMSDNVILLQYVELDSSVKRALSILKMRGSDHDKDVREFKIDERGITMMDKFKGQSGILTGRPTKTIDSFNELLQKMG